MYKEKIVNVLTGQESWRDLTAEEIDKIEQSKQNALLAAQAEAEAQAKRSAALAKLEALGLNEDDLKALGL